MRIDRQALDVEGHNVFKDSYSKAIISSDIEALEKHRASKKRRREEYENRMKMQDEIKDLKGEIGELKSMMMEILKSKQE